MMASAELDTGRLLTTDGEIALINLESARRRSWSRFFTNPQRDGIAETVVEHEQLTLQFVGDTGALDRLEWLASSLAAALPSSPRAHSSRHGFCRWRTVLPMRGAILSTPRPAMPEATMSVDSD
jgi:hypothetical protein